MEVNIECGAHGPRGLVHGHHDREHGSRREGMVLESSYLIHRHEAERGPSWEWYGPW